jgi:hypothetical protein
MIENLVQSGLKVPEGELTALRQLALHRSLRSGHRVTAPDLLRPLVTAFLNENRDEVELALRMVRG